MFRRSRKPLDEPALYEYAVGALARRMRSVAEMKRLLRPRVTSDAEGEAMVEAVVRRLKDHNYLNDSTYAATFSASRKENEKLGRRRVVTELKARGVHGEVIEKAVDAAYEGVNEENLARAFLARKRMRKPAGPKEAARIFRAMARAGFSTGVIFGILKKWDVEDEVLTALEAEDDRVIG
jgi:regulatory protein